VRRLLLAIAILSLGAAACGSRTLLLIDVTGDKRFEDVVLRVSAVRSQPSSATYEAEFREATFDTTDAYELGLYLPSGWSGTLTVNAKVIDGACEIASGTATAQDVKAEEASAVIPIRVTSHASCVPVSDGGVGGRGGSGGGAGGSAGGVSGSGAGGVSGGGVSGGGASGSGAGGRGGVAGGGVAGAGGMGDGGRSGAGGGVGGTGAPGGMGGAAGIGGRGGIGGVGASGGRGGIGVAGSQGPGLAGSTGAMGGRGGVGASGGSFGGSSGGSLGGSFGGSFGGSMGRGGTVGAAGSMGGGGTGGCSQTNQQACGQRNCGSVQNICGQFVTCGMCSVNDCCDQGVCNPAGNPPRC
jgi:hypothetical protein